MGAHHLLASAAGASNRLQANRPVAQQAFTGFGSILQSKDAEAPQGDAFDLPGETLGPTHRQVARCVEGRVTDGLGGQKGMLDLAAKEIVRPVDAQRADIADQSVLRQKIVTSANLRARLTRAEEGATEQLGEFLAELALDHPLMGHVLSGAR